MITPEIEARWNNAIAGREKQALAAIEAFGNLIRLMADLRSPEGCPWDREQSLASLRQYVLEEANEVCEAIDAIVEKESMLRKDSGLPADNPEPPDGNEKARTESKGLSIAHHPHRNDFNPTQSASGSRLPVTLTEETKAELDNLYAHLFKEMGDLMLQSVFLGDILQAMGRGGVERAAYSIVEKLIRRHPHVYGDFDAINSAEVLANWDKIKAAERAAGE